MELIPLVNDDDEIIGYKERAEIQTEDIYRVSALRITNSQGEILVAQRAFTKRNNPGTRWPAVLGTVEKGETYYDNIQKELFEELWVQNCTLTPRFHKRIQGKHNFYIQWYTAEIDEPISYFTFPKEETEAIAWIPKEELLSQIQSNPKNFDPVMDEYIQGSL